ncbi:hypothetical protein Drorol1_Dr00005775 [Drosera rotundifolia]
MSSSRSSAMAVPQLSFSDKPNMMSFYLRGMQNRSLGDLDCGTEAESIRHETMNLFPLEAGFGCHGKPTLTYSPNAAAAQIAIFYDGEIIVLDELTDGKAREKIDLIGSCSAVPKQPVELRDCSFVVGSYSGSDSVNENGMRQYCFGSDMPIARKASLRRFLEKRKEQISMTSPYGLNDGTKASVARSSWLGLATLSGSQPDQ